MQYLVKFAMEYKHAIPGQICYGIQACNTWSNLLRNTNMQYQVNLVRNPNLQYLVKFTKEYKHVIPGQIY